MKNEKTKKKGGFFRLLFFYLLIFMASSCRPLISHEHEWSEWTTATSATCVAKGIETRNCALNISVVCKETRDIPVDMVNGHNWGDYIDIALHPTCTDNGSGTRKCKRNSLHSDTGAGNMPALGHDYENWSVSSPADCENAAVQTGTCSRGDGAQATRAGGGALGHNYRWPPSLTTATCTAGGIDTGICSRDENHTVIRPAAALGHLYYWYPDEECGRDVTQNGTCTRNNTHTDTRTVRVEHLWGRFTQTKAPTPTENGTGTGACTRVNCNGTKSYILYATGSVFTGGGVAGSAVGKSMFRGLELPDGGYRLFTTWIDWGLAKGTMSIPVGHTNDPSDYESYRLVTDIYDFSGFGNSPVEFLPGSQLKSISAATFRGTSFTAITLPDTLVSIGMEAFSGNTKLSMAVPALVTFVGERAFQDWTSSQTLTIRGKADRAATITAGWDANWDAGCNANVVYAP